MTIITRTKAQIRRSIRPGGWLRHSNGAMTLPSQKALDEIVNSPEFPRY